ncbi:MAG: hypothetical protein HOP02_04995 [Methylococcaceae bacterium]|nr:hypothetical protein [Methylococcaceae bacterium]
MQTPVSNIKDILLNWNTITIQSPLMSALIIGALILLVTWFLLSWYYGAKIGKVRRRSKHVIATNEQEKNRLSGTLDATAEELQRVEVELSNQNQQVAQLKNDHKAVQVQINRAVELESQIDKNVTSLQTHFFLNQPLPVKTEGTASLAWQRYSSIVNELTGRLKTYAQVQLELQQEKSALNAVLAQQAITIEELHQKIALQTTHIAQREQAFDTQQLHLLQQQEQLKTELLLAKEQQQLALQQVKQNQAVDIPLQSVANQASTYPNEQIQHNDAVLEAASATDDFFDNLSEQTEEAVQSVFNTFKSLVDADEQPPLSAEDTNVIPVTAIPTLRVAATLNNETNAAAVSVNPLDLEAPNPLPTVTQHSSEQLGKAIPVMTKFKKLLGRFSKSAMVDYVETALEQNDIKVAEQMIEESIEKTQALPKKSKGFWRNLRLTN